jgi:hypothetical protein
MIEFQFDTSELQRLATRLAEKAARTVPEAVSEGYALASKQNSKARGRVQYLRGRRVARQPVMTGGKLARGIETALYRKFRDFMND